MIGARKLLTSLIGSEGVGDEANTLLFKLFDSYDKIGLEPDSKHNGIIRNRDSFSDMEDDESIGFGIGVPGEITVVINGYEGKGVVRYKDGEKLLLLKELFLMFSGKRPMDADAADIMPILEKGCDFYWVETTESDLLESGTKLLETAISSSEKERVSLVVQASGNLSLLVCSQLFEKLDNDDRIENAICQIVDYTEEGECILSVLCD